MSDLISRQAAIDTLERGKDKTAKGDIGGFYNKIIQNDIDKIKDLPSEEPEPRWIPCSQRLPEELYVLCCDDHGEMLIANPFKCEDSDTGYSAESDDCYMYNCIAWMPLPEPYRECADAILQMHSAKSKIGKWVLHDGYYCTLCGYKLLTTAIPDRCPSCMADMRGK